MNTRQRFEEILTEMGVFEEQASAIMDKAIPIVNEQLPNYRITWDRPSEEYPDAFYSVVFITVKRAALEWIDENIPQAWFRPMFV